MHSPRRVCIRDLNVQLKWSNGDPIHQPTINKIRLEPNFQHSICWGGGAMLLESKDVGIVKDATSSILNGFQCSQMILV